MILDDNESERETRCFRKMEYEDYDYHYDLPRVYDEKAIKKSIYTENNDIGAPQTLETEYDECGDIY